MNKQEFLNVLSERLQGIPKQDREKSIEYYSEMIDDRTQGNRMKKNKEYVIIDQKELVNDEKVF